MQTTDINGNAYTFSVKEVDADGNDFTPTNYVKSGEGTLEITNTYVSPKNGTAVATKEWVGGPTPETDSVVQAVSQDSWWRLGRST